MIDLYYWPTANGKKVAILLEEARIAYRVVPVNITIGSQLAAEFVKLNPNHRIPVITDDAPAGGGSPLTIFESGAILFYLAEKARCFWPQPPREKYSVAQWVIWQVANMGPKIGEYNHFHRLGGREGDQSYAQRRFDDETNRLYGVLNNGLCERPFLAAEEFTIADMAVFPWANNWRMHGQDITLFPHVERWLELVAARPGVQRGMEVGKDLVVDPARFSPEQQDRFRKLIHNQRAIPAPSAVKL
jgi:GSH-dependent disulfide-bond oxidoreductase